MSSFEKNLSEGNVAKQLVLFSLPFLASNIIQSLYSVADMLIVGRFSGTTSMSGVNLGSQVTLILTNIVVGLCAGGTVLSHSTWEPRGGRICRRRRQHCLRH